MNIEITVEAMKVIVLMEWVVEAVVGEGREGGGGAKGGGVR